MKQIVISMLFAVLLFSNCFADSATKQAVRDYLTDKRIPIDKELFWGEVDSVFSSYNIQLSYDYFSSSIKNDIKYLEIDKKDCDSYGGTYAKESKEIADSIIVLKDSLRHLEKNYQIKMIRKELNRKGIRFTYESTGKRYDFIFVFNNDGETIGHVIDSSGKAIEL